MSIAFAFVGACGGHTERVAHPEPEPIASSASSPPAPPEPLAAPEPSPQPAASSRAPSLPSGSFVPALACEIKGSPLLAKGTNLFTEAQGSAAVASFAGQPVSLAVTGFPASAAGARVRVHTSGGLRIEGFVDAAELPLYLAAEVAIVPGHVWLAQGQGVSFAGASNALSVEGSVAGPVSQTFRASVPCSALSLDKRPRVPWDVPGNGRGYLAQKSSLELRDQPGGAIVQTLRVAEGSNGPLLWSTETQAGYVHVLYHADVVLDGWVASADLAPLKQGEMMDRLAPPQAVSGSARLSIGGQPTLVRAEKPVPLRLSPQDTATPVGAIETGGEVYLIQTVLGWTSVLPRALNVLPPGDHSFWVPSSEVGKAK